MWFTGVDVHSFLTVPALYSAAPFELALAFAHTIYTRGVVPAAAAHDLAAVRGSGRLVTHPSCCTQRT